MQATGALLRCEITSLETLAPSESAHPAELQPPARRSTRGLHRQGNAVPGADTCSSAERAPQMGKV